MKIKRIMNTIILAGTLAGASYAAPLRKPSMTLTRVQAETPINVMEVVGKPLKNVDFYGVAQEDKNYQLYKIRVQWTPLNSKPFSFGVALQTDNNNFQPAKIGFGLIGRIQGKLSNKNFGKIDLRYFPEHNVLDTYNFVTTPKMYVDCLAKFDLDSKFGFVKPGIDYKLDKNNSIGLETKLSGKFSNLKNDYVGVRYKVKF